MRHIIIILVLSIIFNFLFLGLSYGSNSVGVSAIVPVTPENINSPKLDNKSENSQKHRSVLQKENTFLYFFDKSLEEKQKDNYEVQSVHDRIFSYGLLLFIMIIVAAIILLLCRLIDRILKLKK